MATLRYVGNSTASPPSGPTGLSSLNDTTGAQTILDNLPVNRNSVTNSINAKAAEYATAASLAATLNPSGATGYAQWSYMKTENAKCILSSKLGRTTATDTASLTGRVASTDASNLIPENQLPSMGNGYIIGPLGTTNTYAGSATTLSNGPLKIAEWAIKTNSITFQPLVFMVVNTINTLLGRTVIEVRITNGAATSYSTSDPLVAIGTGRSFYYGTQAISVLPCAAINSQSGTTASVYGPSYNTYLPAWMYDAGSGTSTISSSSIASASAFLMRVAT